MKRNPAARPAGCGCVVAEECQHRGLYVGVVVNGIDQTDIVMPLGDIAEGQIELLERFAETLGVWAVIRAMRQLPGSSIGGRGRWVRRSAMSPAAFLSKAASSASAPACSFPPCFSMNYLTFQPRSRSGWLAVRQSSGRCWAASQPSSGPTSCCSSLMPSALKLVPIRLIDQFKEVA